MQTPPKKLNVLLYNWHEPYICLFAHTGHTFFVAPPKQQLQKIWNHGFRPLPGNVTEVTFEQAESGLRDGHFDLLVCLSLQDLESVQHLALPRLFVMLNMIGTDVGLEGQRKDEYVERLKPLFRNIAIAFISEKKRANWGWEAPVVVSGVDPGDYGGYTGELPRVLRVGNMLKERDHMQGFSIQEEILHSQFPSSIVGINPSVPESRPTKSWEDLRQQFRTHRLLLNTLTDAHEDGYNLAVLEAMATGMPVVSTSNTSSPIVDGFNGFVSDDFQYLREKIQLLMDDREMAAELGRNGQRTVEEKFHIEKCATAWSRVFSQCVVKKRAEKTGYFPQKSTAAANKSPRRLKILLAAPSNPLSTSAYYERSLRRCHDVLTCGPRVDEKTMSQWQQWEDQHALKTVGAGGADKMGLLLRLARDCDIPLPWGTVSAAEALAELPSGWRPDLVIWIDAGPEFQLLNLDEFGCTTACLVGDLHTGDSDWRVKYARQFKHSFLMFNRDYITRFESSGSHASWLPAACDPEIHRRFQVPKAYDVVFVGQTMPAWHKDRVRLLERLKKAGFDLCVDSKILEEMALLFSRGRLVFNRSLNGDLNMRVFEALACGSLLITDRLPTEAGLEELFGDHRHLVLYDDDNLEELVAHYLNNEQEREAIAKRGRAEVLANHTYGHRVDQMLAEIFPEEEFISCVSPTDKAETAGVIVPNDASDLPAYYQNQRPEILALIPPSSRWVLDVGCAAGEMGRQLKAQRPGVQVVGIEKEERALERARDNLDVVIPTNMDMFEALPYPAEFFDCITCGDILEHLRDPELVLAKLLSYLKPNGTLVCSIPNIRHQSVLLDLLVNGRWQYQDEGLLDRTHIHFFTLAEIQAMMNRLGLKISKMSATQSPVENAMEPILKAVGALGGDVGAMRQESRIMQYIFQASRAAKKQQVTVIMPVFNQAEHTERCLHALAANTEVAEVDYELVVVDNGSTDWTPYLVNAFEGDVQLLSNDTNLGFARACNQGAEVAQSEYLLFLNNDTLPHPGWLRALVEVAKSDQEIGIVGAKLLYPDTEQVQHAGLMLHNGIPEHVHRGAHYTDPEVEVQREMDMVTGACMLVRSNLFNDLGGFDEMFLNGMEDVDFCLRVRDKGFKVLYCPRSVLDHWEGSSEGRFDTVQANVKRFHAKWGNRFGADGRFVPKPEESGEKSSIRVNFEGPFFLPSSLAHVNRELVRQLLATGEAEIGLVPFGGEQPSGRSSRFEGVVRGFGRVLPDADFHLRHHWPPNFTKPAVGKLVIIQPWEFGHVPSAWIEPIAANVDQVWVPSSYVRSCYVDSGVDPDKVVVVPNGVDVEHFNPQVKPMQLATEKSFKFLFVGGTLYRKGIDLLLKAYRSTFSPEDDVCLVVKDMGTNTFYRNQHAGESIRALQNEPSCPEILYLTDDMPDDEMASLYLACNCLAHPYRGEGFGLPVAEAMACGLPTIVTAGGACDDFCDHETTYLIPATRHKIQYEQPTAGDAWLLEPDIAVLSEQMRSIFDHPEQSRRKGQAAACKVASTLTWKHAAEVAVRNIRQLCTDVGEDETSVQNQEVIEAIQGPSTNQVHNEGTPISAGVAVVVFGGTGKEDIAGFCPDGGWVERYDVKVAEDLKFGEQLDAIQRHSGCDTIAVMSADSCPTAATATRLLKHLRAEPACAMIGPGSGSASNGHSLEKVDCLEPNLVLIRRAAIETVSGIDSGFFTMAVLDDLARCCRRQGWIVIRDNGSLNPRHGEPRKKVEVLDRERTAVREIKRGDDLKETGDFAAALQAYNNALKEKGDYVEAAIGRASILVERGERDMAVKSLERLVQIDPNSVRAWNYLGLVQYQSQRWGESNASFEKALSLESNNVEVLVNLAVLQWEQGAASEALDNLERAAAIEPSNKDVIVNTALMHSQTGNSGTAIELLQGFTEQHIDDLEAKIVLGEMLLENGQAARARLLALQVLAAQAGHERALGLLESLGGQKEQESER